MHYLEPERPANVVISLSLIVVVTTPVVKPSMVFVLATELLESLLLLCAKPVIAVPLLSPKAVFRAAYAPVIVPEFTVTRPAVAVLRVFKFATSTLASPTVTA